METMLIVDGNSILNRAFYGIRLLTNKEGLYTNAIYGMVTIISKHIEALHPNYCAVAFDLKAPTFRHKMYEGYKANRKGMPEELAVQLPYAKECMENMGLHVVTCEGFEADDILGTLSDAMGKKGIKVYVLTGDRDSLQLIDENVSVLLVKTKETVLYDTQEFLNQYGILPSSFVSVKALMGDSSDNIPGVAGIGEKTALKLISEYLSVDSLYEKIEEAEISVGLKSKLLDGREMAYLSEKLAEICRTAPIETKKEAYRYDGILADALRDLFLRLDFTALIKKFNLDNISEQQSPSSSDDVRSLMYRVTDSLESIHSKELCAHISDQTLELFDGELLCKIDLNEINLHSIQSFLEDKKFICQDYKLIYKSFSSRELQTPECAFDCSLAAYVLDSGRGNYTLSDLYVRYMNTSLSEEIPVTVQLKELCLVLREEIENNGFSSLLYDIELPLARVLAEMEINGFKIDCEGIKAYGNELKVMAEILRERIYSYAGEEFNIGSPKQLGEVLFEKMGLPKSRKTKTGYSTDAETLQKLINRHPIIEDILDYRQVTKLKSTYADGLVKAADPFGKIHTMFNQTGTATGRLSSSEPNLQNIPVRTELGRTFRKFFVPTKEDYVLIDADYSQIELRLLAHISNDEAMIASFLSGEDIHAMTASRVFNVPIDQVTSDLRKKAKAVNFGILYGIGEYSLSEDLGITRAQAKEYIDSYFEKFPQIRGYLDQVKTKAKQDGYVTTFFGRRRYIPELLSSNKNLQHFGERIAMNSPIQGTAADIIKLSMICVSEVLREKYPEAKLILQVHDELLIEAPRSCAEEVKHILIECMERVVDFSVPLQVDAHVGPTWFEAK